MQPGISSDKSLNGERIFAFSKEADCDDTNIWRSLS